MQSSFPVSLSPLSTEMFPKGAHNPSWLFLFSAHTQSKDPAILRTCDNFLVGRDPVLDPVESKELVSQHHCVSHV